MMTFVGTLEAGGDLRLPSSLWEEASMGSSRVVLLSA